MDIPLAQLLHRSLSAEPPSVPPDKNQILKALDQEASRQYLSSLRRLWLSAVPLFLVIAWMNTQLSFPLEDRVGPLAIAALIAVFVLWWRKLPSRARALPMRTRFQQAVVFRALAGILLLVPAGILMLYAFLKAAEFPQACLMHFIEHPFLLCFLLAASGLPIWGIYRFARHCGRRLDPYWFE